MLEYDCGSIFELIHMYFLVANMHYSIIGVKWKLGSGLELGGWSRGGWSRGLRSGGWGREVVLGLILP